jgi:hypothetical protein
MASLLAGAGISAITGLIGGGKQSSAIKSAANTEAQAADYAANLSSEAENNSLQFTKDVYGNTENNEQPYQAAGTTALQQLAAGTAAGGEFNSTPTAQQVLAQDPGYEFNLEQGQQALERAEAAGGSVGSGGALKAGVQYASDYANNEYNNAYQRYITTRQNNYTNLANLAGYGLSADSTLAGAGTAAAGNVSNTELTGAAQQGSDLTSAASATAAGTTGAANADASSLNNIGNLAVLAGLAQNSSASGYKNPASVAPDQVGYGEGSAASNFGG